MDFFHRSLSPTIETGSLWPLIGIFPFNVLQIPLLSTGSDPQSLVSVPVYIWTKFAVTAYVPLLAIRPSDEDVNPGGLLGTCW
jgi:Cytochrome c oxidase subunit III.